MRQYLLLVFVCFGYSVLGQQMAALETGNYAGLNGLYLNPSAIADSRWGGMVQLGMGSLSFSSQPVGIETILFNKSRLKFAKETWGINSQDLRGPGVMFQLRPRHAVAFTSRYRSDYNFQGSNELLSWFGGSSNSFTTNNLQFSNHAFSEYGISYAVSVLDYQKHALKVGATYKILRGLQMTNFNANGSLSATNNNNLAYNFTNLQYNFSDLSFTEKFSVTDWLLSKTPGRGSSVDIGFTYEFRPKAEIYRYSLNGKQIPDLTKTKYLLRLGAALLDMGSITYANNTLHSLTDRRGTFSANDFKNLTTTRQYQSLIWQKWGLNNEVTQGAYSYQLPTTLAVQLDARMSQNWFMGAVLKSNKDLKTFSIGPRYESQAGEFSLTGNYNSLTQKFTAGMHLRLAVFVAGTDNIVGFFKNNGVAPNFFAGAYIPIMPKRPKDRDRDYISDRKDACPDVQGIWTFRGCPDTDNDGIKDQDDKCPNDAGPKETNGCPDADRDGIFDKNDACPNEAGLVKFNGCPDLDNDGIADKDDECPREAGKEEQGGCPDTDNDGLKDSQDKCPTEVGLKEIEGCALMALTQADTNFTASENALLIQLTNDWKAGFKVESVGFQQAKEWLSTHPNGAFMLEFLGKNQEELLRLATLFKGQIETVMGNQPPFKLAIKVRAEQANGLKISLNR